MKDQTYPGLELIDRIIQANPENDSSDVESLLLNPILDRYFFSKLDRSDWMPILMRANLLNSEAINKHPYRLYYLQRLINDHAIEVTDLLNTYYYTTPGAQNAFLEIIKDLPQVLMRVVLPKLEHFHVNEEQENSLFAAEKLVSHVLHNENYRDVAWYLTRWLLLPLPNLKDSYHPYRLKLDDWNYLQFLSDHRQYLEVHDWYPSLLIELLATFSALYVNSYDGTFGSENHVHLNHNLSHDIHSAPNALLQETLRFLPEVAQIQVPLPTFWTQLERFPYALLGRLRLLLLAGLQNPPAEPLRAALLDPFAFQHYPEYGDAARIHFARLAASDRETIWSWLEADSPAQTLAWWANEPADQKQRHHRRKLWRELRRLQPHIPDRLKDQWANLVAEFGNEEYSGPEIYIRDGPNSTITIDDLGRMSIPQVAEILSAPPPSTGDPHFDSYADRVEGFGNALAGDVRRRPAEYLAHTDLLKTFPPQYLQTITMNFRSVEEPAAIHIPALIDLLRFANAQAQGNALSVDQGEGQESSQVWSWIVGSIADLLEGNLMNTSSVRAQIDHASVILDALTQALSDPDPAPDVVVINLTSYGDAFTRSLNVTRGKVVHALLRFMGWMHERHTKHGDPAAATLLALSKHVLSDHLISGKERSGAVYAAVVNQLPWLLYTDPEYATPLIETLFDRGKPEVSKPVWATHLHLNAAYNRMFILLRSKYAAYAAEDLPSSMPLWSTEEDTQTDFAHLVGVFFLRNEVDFGQDDRIPELLLDHGHAGALANSVKLLNRNLRNTREEKDKYYPRLCAWWAALLAIANHRSTEEAAILRGAVGELFTNPELPLDWRFSQLEGVLDQPLTNLASYWVVQTLVEQADAAPEVLARSLKLITRLTQQNMDGMVAYKTGQLLKQLQSRTEIELTAPINELVETMVALGYIDGFREFHR